MIKKSMILPTIINNSFEYYQVIVFGFFSPVLAPIFFPLANQNASFLATLLAFAAGYLMNPFGGLIFGYMGDRFGRKSTITLSIILSSLPTFVIGVLPSYQTLGMTAPCILIFCRLLQGFSVGGQSYSSVVFVTEQAGKGKVNFACSFLAASSLIGGVLATAVGALCILDVMPKWMWRIPFILGGLFGVIGYLLVKNIDESKSFENAKQSNTLSKNPIGEVTGAYLKNFLCTIAISGATLIPFYMISIYAINSSIPLNFNFSPSQIMLTNTFFMAMWIVFLPMMGFFADKIENTLIMKYSALFMFVLSFPLCWLIQVSTSLPLTLSCLALLSLCGAGYVAPSGAFMTQLFPVPLRCSGLSVASGVGSALLGGTAPAIGDLLVQETGAFSFSALYIMLGSLMGYFGVKIANISSRSKKTHFLDSHMDLISSQQNQLENPHRLIATLNKQGYMLADLHEYSRAFVDFAPYAPGPVLDIGASYGVASIPALQAGAYVIANDIEMRHLEILKKNTPNSCLDRLELKPGKVPREVDFSENSLGAVLASGVLHFLSGDELIESIDKIYRWLKPGGKFFFATSTPFTKIFHNFLPVYRERKKVGQRWPGFIEDTAEYIPNIAEEIPKSINLLDKDIVQSLLLKVGFTIEKIGFFKISQIANAANSEGNEILGAIAVKKNPLKQRIIIFK